MKTRDARKALWLKETLTGIIWRVTWATRWRRERGHLNFGRKRRKSFCSLFGCFTRQLATATLRSPWNVFCYTAIILLSSKFFMGRSKRARHCHVDPWCFQNHSFEEPRVWATWPCYLDWRILMKLNANKRSQNRTKRSRFSLDDLTCSPVYLFILTVEVTWMGHTFTVVNCKYLFYTTAVQ